MNEHNIPKEDTLHIIREVEDDPSVNQRLISERLNISLGKTNYLLKALAQKGFIKAVNFTKFPKKSQKKAVRYLLTPEGLKQKMDLTYHFLKIKEKEYERLKQEYDKYMVSASQDLTQGGEDV